MYLESFIPGRYLRPRPGQLLLYLSNRLRECAARNADRESDDTDRGAVGQLDYSPGPPAAGRNFNLLPNVPCIGNPWAGSRRASLYLDEMHSNRRDNRRIGNLLAGGGVSPPDDATFGRSLRAPVTPSRHARFRRMACPAGRSGSMRAGS